MSETDELVNDILEVSWPDGRLFTVPTPVAVLIAEHLIAEGWQKR